MERRKSHRVDLLRIRGGFLDGFAFKFPEKINCGTGDPGTYRVNPVALIEYIKKCFLMNAEFRNQVFALLMENLARYEECLIKHPLAPATIHIVSPPISEPPKLFISTKIDDDVLRDADVVGKCREIDERNLEALGFGFGVPVYPGDSYFVDIRPREELTGEEMKRLARFLNPLPPGESGVHDEKDKKPDDLPPKEPEPTKSPKKKPAPAEEDWLVRETDTEDPRYIIWKTIAKNGETRIWRVKEETKQCKLLNCIKKARSRQSISHYDIKDACQWDESVYRAKKGGESRGPLKNHITKFRAELGMRIVVISSGIKVDQPEK